MYKWIKNNRQMLGFILLVIGIIGHAYIGIAGSLEYPLYNRTAAYLWFFKDHLWIGIPAIVNIILGYGLVMDT